MKFHMTNINKSTSKGLLLYDYHEVPVHLQDNPFILKEYRAFYSTKMCFKSLFTVHNESGNIWTHLIGFFVFIFISIQTLLSLLNSSYTHLFLFLFFSLSCLICMLCSSVFHLFLSHYHDSVYHFFHVLDYVSISSLIVGSFYPFCYLSFSCDPVAKWTYLSSISIFGTFGIIGPFFPQWRSPKFATFKTLFYIIMAGSGLVPLTHFTLENRSVEFEPFIVKMFTMLILYFIGVMIYSLQIPERFFPGYFDIWFHSHQLWHLFVLGAALVHFFNVKNLLLLYEIFQRKCINSTRGI